MRNRSHRGSALLVVLGMIAFMVVSAVAFSAYMRYSRLPSSFLRQTDASRLLVKAALANAIDEVDAAIGNNPHPGVGTAATMYPRKNGRSWQRNSWIGRVYMGTNTSAGVSAQESATVTPLTFEGLAYLPPPLVNEVRYYSRRSAAAQWHGMNFDAGRYAFCAVDVSDYFDVNALGVADLPRSSDPVSRISLAYLFDTDNDEAALCSASTWDSFMKNFQGSTKLPLVSLADWNLALNNGGPFKSQFCTYVTGGRNSFYDVSNADDIEAEKIRRMTFVTDSYLPVRDEPEVLHLSFEDKGQPWSESQLNETWKQNACEIALSNDGAEHFERLRDHLPGAALAALYDYLDEDDVPCSLALPTLERTPLICGLSVDLPGAILGVKDMIDTSKQFKYNTTDPATSATRTQEQYLQYNLDASKLKLDDLTVNALVTYPFRHRDGLSVAGYKIDGALLVFLSPKGEMGLRPGDAIKRLTADGCSDERVFDTALVKDNVISVPLKGPDDITKFDTSMGNLKATEADFVMQVQLTPRTTGSIASDLESSQNALLSATLQREQTADPILDSKGNPTGKYDWANPRPANADIIKDSDTTVAKASCDFKPLGSEGQIAKGNGYDFSQKDDALFTVFRKNGVDLQLNVAVIVRVVNKNGKTVDMVPACLACDDAFNRRGNASGDFASECISAVGGGGSPLLRFDIGPVLQWSQTGFDAAQKGTDQLTVSPKSIYVGDPRYNYAPESWFKSDNELQESEWLSNCGAHEADGDIFLQVSDQKCLQSVFELANLPRIGENGLVYRGDRNRGKIAEPESFQGVTFAKKGSELNRAYMWKTYDPFGRYRNDVNSDQNGDDGFAQLRIAPATGGFRVNPYSDSTNILMAAFANTPIDWRCASVDNKEISAGTASAFNSQYAWSEKSSGGQLYQEELEDIAGEFMAEIRQNHVGNDYEEPWEVALRSLGWQTVLNSSSYADRSKCILEDLELDQSGGPISNADRKFLYGFWHDCFSARQQLFLIFVRAEPVMMGGGAIGQTPPQLGARAVALVWRDPHATSTANAPHRTRILFYRQFD